MEAEARTEIERLITCQVIESFGLDISSFALDMTTFAIYIDSANTEAYSAILIGGVSPQLNRGLTRSTQLS